MILITAYLRPHKLEQVKMAIADLPITGLTVADCRGRGNSEEPPVSFGGQVVQISLPVRSKLTVVVEDDLKDDVIKRIIEHAWTGEPGDGKITVERINDAIRIRTQERGDAAI